MGREAECMAELGGERVMVKALLEPTELLLRGAAKRRYRLEELLDLMVSVDALRFRTAQEAVALHLGAVEAARWVTKINTPAPSLAAKLGITAAAPAWVWGKIDDEALAAALAGAQTNDPAEASCMVALARNADDLAQAQVAHARLPTAPLWVVHPKGKDSSLSDATVRTVLRGAGFKDNKTCAVSAALTATRYRRA